MIPHAVVQALAALEAELQAITDALAEADSHKLLSVSESLRKSALALKEIVRQLTPAVQADPQLRRRLLRLANGMALCRENLARRTVLVERRLQTIVPSAGADSYGKSASPYAKLGRQSAWSGALAA